MLDLEIFPPSVVIAQLLFDVFGTPHGASLKSKRFFPVSGRNLTVLVDAETTFI
jgi:hypothetical protein